MSMRELYERISSSKNENMTMHADKQVSRVEHNTSSQGLHPRLVPEHFPKRSRVALHLALLCQLGARDFHCQSEGGHSTYTYTYTHTHTRFQKGFSPLLHGAMNT